jgi:2-polyprenyl-6-methoxyphenol hydroxylase-like FAD-dependent oxidoreductase
LHILYDAAMRESENGASVTVEFGVEVFAVDFDECSVTLRSGEKHSGDVLIGADGVYGLLRRRMLEEEGEEPDDDVSTGVAVYRCGHSFRIRPRTCTY